MTQNPKKPNFVHTDPRAATEQIWRDYVGAIRGTFPREEADSLLVHMRPIFDRDWYAERPNGIAWRRAHAPTRHSISTTIKTHSVFGTN